MKEAGSEHAFSVQVDIRGPWRTYLDLLAPVRPVLYRHCLGLTGNVWDAEDLVQDALLRVFSLLGKIDADIAQPQAYLTRTASNLWVDALRRRVREETMLRLQVLDDAEVADESERALDAQHAAAELLAALAPQQRAAIVMKDVLEFSLREIAEHLDTTVGAVKSALSRGRARLSEPHDVRDVPDRATVEAFMQALRDTDLVSLKSICAADLVVELVGGAETRSFDDSTNFFAHAHFVMPELGFGENPRWTLEEHAGEPIVVGFRTLEGVEGINEVHRLTVVGGQIRRVRCYCFCPDTLQALAEALDTVALARPYRSPSAKDYGS